VETLSADPELTQILQADQILRLGAIPRRESYGWIIQIGNTPIAKGKGPAHGNDPHSFQAEDYGMASALVFLQLLQQQYYFRAKPESQNHYIQCGAPSQIKWRIVLLATTIHKQMERNFTDKYLQETILDCCIDSTLLAVRQINTNGPFHQVLVVVSQEQIGGVGMLRGYWSKEWNAKYEKTYDTPLDKTRKQKNKRSLQMARWQKKNSPNSMSGDP
jgi:hypothetical protein